MENYREAIQNWINAYEFCLSYEKQIEQGLISDSDIDAYLNEKSRLIACTGSLFLVHCIEVKEKFDKEYIFELYDNLKDELNERNLQLTKFDKEYISEMLDKLEDDFKEMIEDLENAKNDEEATE